MQVDEHMLNTSSSFGQGSAGRQVQVLAARCAGAYYATRWHQLYKHRRRLGRDYLHLMCSLKEDRNSVHVAMRVSAQQCPSSLSPPSAWQGGGAGMEHQPGQRAAHYRTRFPIAA